MTMWEDLGADAVLAMADTTGAIDMTKDSMQEMVNTRYDSISSALGSLWRTIQVDVLQPIGKMLIPYVSKGIDKIKEMTNWWNNLEPATQKNIVRFAIIAATIPPVVFAIGNLITGIGGAITTFGKMRSAVTKISAAVKGAGGVIALLTSPVGIAVAAVTVLTVAGIALYKNWDKVKAWLSKTWESITKGASELWSSFKEFGNNITTKFLDAWETTKNGVVGFFTDLYNAGVEKFEALKTMLANVGDFISGAFTTTWSKAWNGLKGIVGNAFGALEGIVKTPINAVISLVNGAIDGINSIHFTVPDLVPGIGGKGWEGLGIPHIPKLAKGTDNWRGGIVQVHERGGEIIDLPQGSRVYPHDESVRMARADGEKRLTINIAKLTESLVIREESDIDKVAEALARKLEQTAFNMA